MNDVDKNISDYNPRKSNKTLFAFDGMTTDTISNKKF